MFTIYKKKQKLHAGNDPLTKSDPSSGKELAGTAGDEEDMVIDWDSISKQVGNGHSSNDCKIQFMSLHHDENDYCKLNELQGNDDKENKIKDEKDRIDVVQKKTSPKSTMESGNEKTFLKEEIIQDILSKTSPDFVERALNASISMDKSNLVEAKNATILASIAFEAMENATKEEEKVNVLQLEILKQRMLKLENRMSLLNETEALLDFERTMLELERRDLYTARCRYWLGGEIGLG